MEESKVLSSDKLNSFLTNHDNMSTGINTNTNSIFYDNASSLAKNESPQATVTGELNNVNINDSE